MIKNRNILVAITGSIAIYKTAQLIRLYIKAGADVKVVMTSSAMSFINPLVFEALTRNRVLTDKNESWANSDNHIDLAKWAELFVIAPATANTINKLSNGIADNLLTQIALAYTKTTLIAPSANTNMLHHSTTQASLKMLKLNGYKIIDSQSKLLACGDEGDGAMAEPIEIYHQSIKELSLDEYWSNRRVVVSSGGVIEKIDDVRYISNFSSGKMGSNLALALYYRGADVCIVSTKDTDLPKDIHVVDVQSSNQMLEYLSDCIRVAKKGVFLDEVSLVNESKKGWIKKKPYLFMASAVSDYIPKYAQKGKLKKEFIGDSWSLELEQNIDILATLDKSDIFAFGFKAEMDKTKAKENALNMLSKKSLDGVILNILKDDKSFGSEEHEITLLLKDNEYKIPKDTKLNISLKLLDLVKSHDK